MFYNQKDGVN